VREEGRRRRGDGGVGDGSGVRKDSENSRRHSSAPRACKFARIDSGEEKQRETGRERESERIMIGGREKEIIAG